MGKQRFRLELSGEIVLELDDTVIAVVDDAWREHLYQLNTPEDIARHIGINMAVDNLRLNQLDGWADQPNENASIESMELYAPTVERL
jgi:hypothetical protein